MPTVQAAVDACPWLCTRVLVVNQAKEGQPLAGTELDAGSDSA